MSFSGGCQCGAVRYRAAKAPAEPHLCHCRMCQKAAGNYFMPLGGVAHEDFEVTRGAISWFHSSDLVRRGFCARCGTPLIYETIGDDHVAITLGSLVRNAGDDPSTIRPIVRWLVESRQKGRWGNTQENAWALEALVDYYRKYEAVSPDFLATASLGIATLARRQFAGRSTEAFRRDVTNRHAARVGAAGVGDAADCRPRPPSGRRVSRHAIRRAEPRCCRRRRRAVDTRRRVTSVDPT